MGFEANLEKDEKMLYFEIYSPHRRLEPFALGISDQAIYFAEKKSFIVSDPWMLRKIPLAEVKQVSLVKAKSKGLWVLAAMLIIAGLATSILMIIGWDSPGAKRSGIPFGVLAVGIALPFVAKGRLVLKLETHDRHFQWKSPLTIESEFRKKAVEIQCSFIRACKQVGINTHWPKNI